jgi:hypothetical protein
MRRVPILFLVLASVGGVFVALPLVGLLTRAPWGEAW